jgi:hypothetical protein
MINRIKVPFALCAGLFIIACVVRAQTSSSPPPTPQMMHSPTANPADVATMDAIIAALYDVISGPAGKPRDWNRFRSLFLPGARLIPTNVRSDNSVVSRVLDVEEYIARASENFAKMGFFEGERARRTETFGNIAHVFSTYESRHDSGDAKPFNRGINSIQLVNDGKRWWVVTIFWQNETPTNPLPPKYLKSEMK